jgi:hypothetical protein
MTHPRPLAFRLAAGAIVAAAVVLCFPPGERNPEPTGGTSPASLPAPPPAPLTQRPVEPPRGTEPPDPSAARRQRARARGVARRFLRAFLRYQSGQLDPATRRAVRRAATGPLARRLLRRPPRPTSSQPPAGRLGRVAVVGPFAGQLKAVARIAYPAVGESLLELALEERDRRLLVTRLYP